VERTHASDAIVEINYSVYPPLSLVIEKLQIISVYNATMNELPVPERALLIRSRLEETEFNDDLQLTCGRKTNALTTLT
jgi:hypothetical protein